MPTSTTPPITAKPSLSTQELSDLTHLSSLLHLAHHRNKNQHRRAPFYRPFSIFRRHLAHIIALYDQLAFIPETHTARHRKRAQDRETLITVQKEVIFLAEVLVPRCHAAFSQLVADLRFGVLGVVLVAVLARVCGVLGFSGWYEDVVEGEVGEVLRRFGREEWGEEDVGEVVRREGGDEFDVKMADTRLDAVETAVTNMATPVKMGSKNVSTTDRRDSPAKTPGKRASTSDRSAKKKKKQKTGDGDAIDDLFDGL